MNVVDLLYNERNWNKRIFEAGEWEFFQEKKCDHAFYGLIGFFIGFLFCFLTIFILISLGF
jgi:hypothetical protein